MTTTTLPPNPQVHLEDEQRITFAATDILLEVLGSGPPRTRLTAFFEKCAAAAAEQRCDGSCGSGAHACNTCAALNTLYQDFVQEFVYNTTGTQKKAARTWHRREHHAQRQPIGRMVAVSLKACPERFYLRLLLSKRKGPTSFLDLRTVNGNACPTYRQACVEMGLLADDNEWDDTLREAAVVTTCAAHLRALYATILTENAVQDAQQLWTTHRDELLGDFMYDAHQRLGATLSAPTDAMQLRGLRHVNQLLMAANTSLAAFWPAANLPDFNAPDEDNGDAGLGAGSPEIIMAQLRFDREALAARVAERTPQLLQPQSAFVEAVLRDVRARLIGTATYVPHRQRLRAAACHFVDAPAGYGKSFCLDILLAQLRSEGHIALAVASTGIGAHVAVIATKPHTLKHMNLIAHHHYLTLLTDHPESYDTLNPPTSSSYHGELACVINIRRYHDPPPPPHLLSFSARRPQRPCRWTAVARGTRASRCPSRALRRASATYRSKEWMPNSYAALSSSYGTKHP